MALLVSLFLSVLFNERLFESGVWVVVPTHAQADTFYVDLRVGTRLVEDWLYSKIENCFAHARRLYKPESGPLRSARPLHLPLCRSMAETTLPLSIVFALQGIAAAIGGKWALDVRTA